MQLGYDDRRSRRGAAMLMAMVCISSLAIASTALIAISASAVREHRGASERLHAQYVAEAALNVGIAEVRAGGNGAIGTEQAPSTLNGSTYWVESTQLSADLLQLTSTAIDDRTGACMQMTLQREVDSIWLWAAFGKDVLHMDSNARTDSYNSALGTYASQKVNGSGASAYADTDGNIGSNGGITLDSNAKVWGDATPGPSSAVVLHSNASVDGSTNPLAEPQELPALVAPTYASNGNKTVSGTFNLAAGNYSYNTFKLNSNATVNVTGPANIVITNFTLNSNTKFYADTTNGPVKVWVLDNLVLDSGVTIRPNNYVPADLELNLLSDNVADPGITIQLDTVSFSSNSSMYGTIYAPEAKLRIDSNFELFGAMMARNIDLDSNCKIHYDEALATTKASGSVEWHKLAWRELPYAGD